MFGVNVCGVLDSTYWTDEELDVSANDVNPSPRPNNMTFVEIPLSQTPRETDELSFVLRPSKIAGVGIIITHPVPKGANLALFQDDPVRRIPYADLEANPQLKAFCLVYGIETQDYVSIPSNFSHMEIGWFLNHSPTPNAVVIDEKWLALRDIEAGEEITINYKDVY